MAAELPKRHANLFHTITGGQFKQTVAALEESIPALARHQIIVELARIVASIGDGHTSIDLLDDPTLDFRRYPLRLYQLRQPAAGSSQSATFRSTRHMPSCAGSSRARMSCGSYTSFLSCWLYQKCCTL